MESNVDGGNAFAIPGIWKSSTFDHFSESVSAPLELELNLLSICVLDAISK